MNNARCWYNWFFGTVAAVVALACLGMGLGFFGEQWGKAHAKYLVGVWMVFPPIFFWVDRVAFCRGLTKDELDVAKHTHELSRNIWVAHVVVLIVLFELKWPGGG